MLRTVKAADGEGAGCWSMGLKLKEWSDFGGVRFIFIFTGESVFGSWDMGDLEVKFGEKIQPSYNLARQFPLDDEIIEVFMVSEHCDFEGRGVKDMSPLS